eukprot:7948250-Lingulodinium_polyedra.AAC.1
MAGSGPELSFTIVEEMKLPGECLTPRGDSRERLEHRVLCANQVLAKHRRVLRDPLLPRSCL